MTLLRPPDCCASFIPRVVALLSFACLYTIVSPEALDDCNGICPMTVKRSLFKHPRLDLNRCTLVPLPSQASINAWQIQTLALLILWAVLPCMAVLYHRPRLLRGVLLFYFLFGTFLAGIEKVHSRWPDFNPMHSFMRIPPLIREPLVPTMLDWLPESSTQLMTLGSMASEILTPILGVLGLCGFSTCSKAAALLNLYVCVRYCWSQCQYCNIICPLMSLLCDACLAYLLIFVCAMRVFRALFTGIIFMMSVPLLFWFAYGAGVSALLLM